MGKYTEAYNEFTAKYELGFNIKAEYDAAKKFAVIDDFTMDTSPAMKAQNIYISAHPLFSWNSCRNQYDMRTCKIFIIA